MVHVCANLDTSVPAIGDHKKFCYSVKTGRSKFDVNIYEMSDEMLFILYSAVRHK